MPAALTFLVAVLIVTTPLQAVVLCEHIHVWIQGSLSAIISLNESWVADPTHPVAGVRSFQFLSGSNSINFYLPPDAVGLNPTYASYNLYFPPTGTQLIGSMILNGLSAVVDSSSTRDVEIASVSLPSTVNIAVDVTGTGQTSQASCQASLS